MVAVLSQGGKKESSPNIKDIVQISITQQTSPLYGTEKSGKREQVKPLQRDCWGAQKVINKFEIDQQNREKR